MMVVPLAGATEVFRVLTFMSTARFGSQRDFAIGLRHRSARRYRHHHAHLYRASQAAVRAREDVLAVVCHDCAPAQFLFCAAGSFWRKHRSSERRAGGCSKNIGSHSARRGAMEGLDHRFTRLSCIEAGSYRSCAAASLKELLKDA